MNDLLSRYQDVLTRARAAAGPRPFTLIAVSKKQSLEDIEALYRLGQRDFGENYVQELVRKALALNARGCTDIRWHMIGHLQTNKVKMLIPHVFSVHTVDSLKVAKELAKRWNEGGRGGKLPVFIEVNIDKEEDKSGVPPGEVVGFVGSLSHHPDLGVLTIQGLMAIPNPELPPEQMKDAFVRLHALGAICTPWTQGQLSMGMSADFEVALATHATHIRVGTALFGERL